MNLTNSQPSRARFGWGKDTELLEEPLAPHLQPTYIPRLATLVQDVQATVRQERRVAEEAARRTRLARQTAGYD